ncbi:MAG: hypothetical protein HYV59_01175 [Planctomycetes bacterium]|nr:hypothetical protein [Planctomycetota bacterium]
MDKTQSKLDVSNLVAKYQRLANNCMLKEFIEAQTVNEFILPRFQFFGWDIHNIHADEVTPEELISKGRVDWAFRIDGILHVRNSSLKYSQKLVSISLTGVIIFIIL